MSTNNTITFKLIIDGKEATATLDTTDQDLKKIIGTNKDVTDSMAKWGMIVTGFNQSLQLAQQAVQVFKEAIMDAATEQAMKDNFKGSADDIELFRQATARTVTEGDLLRLSNQATELGLTVKDQALLFSLSEQAANKMGVGIEEAFQRIVYASEGNTRGLRTIGIQVSVYNKIVLDMLKAQGETITSIDPEILKRIRLDAVIKASGVTLDDVKNKVQNDKEKLQELGVIVEESKEAFGSFVNKGLVPVISALTGSGDASKIMVGGLVSITSFVVPMIPIMTQFKTAQALLATQSLATAGALDAEAVSAKGLLATFALPAAIGIGLGVGAGMTIDYFKDQHDKNLHDTSAYDNQVAENSKNLGWMNNSRYVPGEGTYNIGGNSAAAKKTVEDIEKEIIKLQNQRKDMIPGSKELLNIDKEIAKLQESIKPPDKNAQNNLGQEVAKTEELKGKLEQLKTLRDTSISQYGKDKEVALEDYQAKIKAADAEIEAIKKVAAEKSKSLGKDDIQKIKNDSLQKQVALEEYEQKIIDLTKKHNEAQLTLQNDYDQKLMQLEGKTDLEMLAHKKEYYQTLLQVEDDPDKKKEIQNKIDLLDAETNKMQLEQTKIINLAKIDALEETTAIQKGIKDKASNEEWYREQKELELYKNNVDYKASIDKKYSDTKKKIDKEMFEAELQAVANSLKTIGSLFATHTVAYKAMASTLALIDTYHAAIAAYKSAADIPVVGFVLAPVAAAAATLFGLQQVAAINSEQITGYARGGIVVGENGPEIIAPMDSYAQGQTQLILSTMATLKSEMRSGNFTGNYTSDNTALITEIRSMNSKIEDLASRPSIAYLNDREASKIYNKGNANNRRSKL